MSNENQPNLTVGLVGGKFKKPSAFFRTAWDVPRLHYILSLWNGLSCL